MPFEKMMSMISMNKEKSEKRPEDELEKIDLATFKLKEKYKEYGDFDKFIDYISGIQRIYVMSEMEKWGADKMRQSFIEAESYLMSLDSGIDEDVFKKIKDDFLSAYKILDGIKSVAAKLIKEHSSCPGCVDFIEYMRDSLILLSDTSGGVVIDKNKDRILRSRMLLISNYSEETNLSKLEEVYNKFKSLIKENI